MRALVTGGSGFIGSHLADALLARGDEVAVVDNFFTGKQENLADAIADGAELHVEDITDERAMARVLEETRTRGRLPSRRATPCDALGQ